VRRIAWVTVAGFLACGDSSAETPTEPAPEGADFAFQAIDVQGLHEDVPRICIDGLDKPHTILQVKNVWKEPQELAFSADGGVRVTPLTRKLLAGESAQVRLDVLDLAAPSTFTIQPVGGRWTANYTVELPPPDVRVLDVERVASFDASGHPTVAVYNPMSPAVTLRVDGSGRWRPATREQQIKPHAVTVLELVETLEGPLRPGVAAELRLNGARCSPGPLPELPVVVIPER
jgi:hypothetical protein